MKSFLNFLNMQNNNLERIYSNQCNNDNNINNKQEENLSMFEELPFIEQDDIKDREIEKKEIQEKEEVERADIFKDELPFPSTEYIDTMYDSTHGIPGTPNGTEEERNEIYGSLNPDEFESKLNEIDEMIELEEVRKTYRQIRIDISYTQQNYRDDIVGGNERYRLTQYKTKIDKHIADYYGWRKDSDKSADWSDLDKKGNLISNPYESMPKDSLRGYGIHNNVWTPSHPVRHWLKDSIPDTFKPYTGHYPDKILWGDPGRNNYKGDFSNELVWKNPLPESFFTRSQLDKYEIGKVLNWDAPIIDNFIVYTQPLFVYAQPLLDKLSNIPFDGPATCVILFTLVRILVSCYKMHYLNFRIWYLKHKVKNILLIIKTCDWFTIRKLKYIYSYLKWNSYKIIQSNIITTTKSYYNRSSAQLDQVELSKNLVYNLNLFKTKLSLLRYDTQYNKNQVKSNNFVGKPKQCPPANKEWYNSIYTFSKNGIKLLPAIDKTLLKLVKSYFNFYSRQLEKKVKSRRLRIRGRRLSTNRMLIGRPEVKHTSDKAIITTYIYNRRVKYYFNKIKRIITIDKMDDFFYRLSLRDKSKVIKSNKPWLSNLKMKVIKKKSLNMKSYINKQKKVILSNKTDSNNLANFKSYETKYLKYYAIKSLRKEILFVYIKQLIHFDRSKFEEKYLKPLISLVKKAYNKKIQFNFVNLKYLYLDSHIFSDTLVTKLRNRKNRLLTVLKRSLLMFKMPTLDRLAVYNEIYNKKRKLQNLNFDSTLSKSLPLALYSRKKKAGRGKKRYNVVNKTIVNKDIVESLLLTVNKPNSINNYNDFINLNYSTNQTKGSQVALHYTSFILKSIWDTVRNKFVSGIRIEVAGRLTRRNTAARSVFKLRYRGNIKNMDSSFKGLSTVLLRGFKKANLQYTNKASHIRIGSFGLKGWVSS